VDGGDLISRDELTAYLFTIQDMKQDLLEIRRLLEEDDDDGEADA
jgi:hypothetical protein